MEIDFIPLDYDYEDLGESTVIKIFGKSGSKSCCLLDSFQDFFYIIPEKPGRIEEMAGEIEKIKFENVSRIARVLKTSVLDKNYRGQKVKAIKVYISNHKDKKAISDKIKDLFPATERKERDISPITRYILDKKILPLQPYKVSGKLLSNSQEFSGIDAKIDTDIVLKIEKASQEKEQMFQPKVLAFDIEAEEFEIGKGKILMISMVSDNFQKVLTWKKTKQAEGYTEFFKDEAEMLEAFVKHINELKPDIITGYFSDGFDFPYIKARAEKNKVQLNLGLDGSRLSFIKGRVVSSKITGIVHVDLFKFIESVYSQYLQSETLGLHEVASELIGEGKLNNEHFDKKTESIQEHEWREYFAYNLQDSVITYKLFNKLWPDILEFSRIICEPLYDVSRNRMSQHVEDYIIHNLERFNEIIENRPLYDEIEERRNREKYEGAFVFQPLPGLYENLAIFDFTSMYGSIIVSFNLSSNGFLGTKKQNDAWEVELDDKTRYYFSKKSSFFSSLLSEIIEKRKKYKAEYKKNPNPIIKAKSNAFKLLANAAYGYQGFFGARWYCPEAAASAAALARKFIKETISKIEKAGFKVIYSDTDSIALLLGKKNKKEIIKLLDSINKTLPGIMELELEDFYKRGIWVAKRTGEFGAKKKYALLNEQGKIKIRGFETVRRDWCDLARKLQSRVLELVLKEGNEKSALEHFKDIVKKLKNREIAKESILIKTQLKKPIEEYKSITPHVIAAKKIKEAGLPIDIGMLIKFFIAETREKKALVREKVKLPDEKGEYNIEYYLNHQIMPAVENIFEVFNINVKEIIEGKRQKNLGEF